MEKLKLDVESLDVESYPTAPAPPQNAECSIGYTTTATHNTYCNC